MTSLRAMALAAGLLSITACSGSGSNGLGGILGNGPGGGCDPGTRVTLARPVSGSTNVGSINSIEIVADGNNSTLDQSFSQWQLQALDSFGTTTTGGQLNRATDRGGYQPFPSDFYYSSSFPNLQTGVTYRIFLIKNGCGNATDVGTFST